MSTGNLQSLQRYASPTLVSTTRNDVNSPFLYQTWLRIFQGIIPGEEFKQYNEYLVNWFKDKNQQTTDTNLQLKLNYLTLLRQLQVFFTQEEAENWYNQVDIENEKELLLAIPYFARKLRDISIYYLQLRETIKESRFKYNQTGTETGIEQQTQKLLLLNYTQKPINSITLPASLWKNAPELSSVRETINVTVEELYDTSEYFDKSPTLPASAYDNFNTPELLNFLQRKGLDASSIDWIYNLGSYDLSANNVDELDYPGFIELSKQAAQKYLGSEKYITSRPVLSVQTFSYSIPIIEGNNFFYWPYGAYKDFAKTIVRLQDTPLSAARIETLGTAGSSIENADTIFIKTKRGIKGAWLRDEPYIYFSSNTKAVFDRQTKTDFRFPFPGYGLSAEDTGWTGYSLESDPRFFFLEPSIQQLVLNEYWSNSFELTSNTPIKLNDTTLIDSKAYANINFDLADKITVWPTAPAYNSSNYSGEQKDAWLYRFNKTDISIKTNGNSIIYWPYESFDADTENLELPDYYPKNISTICEPLHISAINFPFSNAGNTLSSADVIYKVKNIQDTFENATECCWLSGTTSTNLEKNVVKTKQATLQGIFNSGEYSRFVWEGPDDTNLNSVFRTLQHQPDCKILNTPGATLDQYSLCTCKQVNFTPYGHPGSQYTDYGSQCDFIFEDTITPSDFEITTWKDYTNTPYLSSTQFFWYNTNGNPGWGNGQWVAGGVTRDRNCFLKTGKTYIYYRAASYTNNKEEQTFPELVVRYDYNNFSINYGTDYLWMRGIKTESGVWVNANEPSQMFIYPGDLLVYSRTNNYTIDYTDTIQQENDISEKRNSLWSNYDYFSINPNKQIIISYPTSYYVGGRPDYELPTTYTEISTRYVNNDAYTLIIQPQVSTARVPSALSAITITNLKARSPEPDQYTVYYNSDNTVSLTFTITGYKEIFDSTKFITTSTVNVASELSSLFIEDIQLLQIDPTPNTYGVTYELDNTVTITFDVTGARTIAPTITPPFKQLPSVPFTNIVKINRWEITNPDGSKDYINDQPTAIFTPTLTGIYQISVVAITSTTVPPQSRAIVGTNLASTFYYTNTGIYTFNDIPALTAISPFTAVQTLTSHTTNIPGFVLNTPLKGWDYSRALRSSFSRVQNSGAKPFWAKAYTAKDVNTGFKGINKWGTPLRNVEQYNFISQPEFSDIVITAGSKITYDRVYNTKLEWTQPVDLQVVSNKKTWCDLEFTTNTDSNIAYQLNNYKTELVVNPTPIAASTVLENIVDNEPVEVYYNAFTPFNWEITAVAEIPIVLNPEISSVLAIPTTQPWANISNQNYPTVATTPNINNLYSVVETGGYFTPSNLGATIYTELDYTLTLTDTTSSLFSITGPKRGFTRQEQTTPYTTTNNNIWQKEPIISGPIAGTNKKDIFKKYQKFIPYQSNFESNKRNQIGLLTPNSRQSPWTGKEDSEWGDAANYPRSFAGEVDVEKWADSQILKKTGLQVDNWVTDVFGNQYGLYKNIKDISVVDRPDTTGEIWVRNNSQFVSPAYLSLANVFDTYQGTNLINELTGFGIKKIDMFFDTLMVKTTGTVIFEKINYDYVTNNIFSLTDDARYISLAMPVTASLEREFTNQNLTSFNFAKCGETWFLPEQKQVFISVCSLQNSNFIPELYRYDINSLILLKVFPVIDQDILLINQLSSLQLQSIDSPVLSYNPILKQFIFATTVKDINNKTNIIELKINNQSQISLDEITVYASTPANTVQEPPIVQANLNRFLVRPQPLGVQYTTTSTQFSSVTANTKLVLRKNSDASLTLITAPVVEGLTVYPLISFSITEFNNVVFDQPILNNYTIYNLNPTYIAQYGSEELFTVEPLNFICEPVINTPAIFEPVSLPSWVNLTPNGLFTGNAPTGVGTYNGSFKVTNSVGPTFYTLNINVV